MENLLTRFKNFISTEQLFQQNDKLLLAVSGGVDSVVLCDLCHKAGYQFVIAHCNFQLRGKESERDEEFVKRLGENYNAEVLVKHFETEQYAKENKLSVQEAARDLRYEWFVQVASQYILTAHHADDNIETVLMNFFKGTGITGLRGIQPKQSKIVRPLLFAKKEEIIAYAKENNLEWVEDSSNESSKYSRNFFRNEIIPLIEQKIPGAKNNVSANIDRFHDIEKLYHQSIEQQKKKLLETKGEEIHIPVLKLKKVSPLNTIVYEIIKEFNFSPAQVNDVISLLDAENGKYIASSSHRILKNRNWLIIASNRNELSREFVVEQDMDKWKMSNGEWRMEEISNLKFQISNSSLEADLDAKLISFPLLIRKWKTGDYFYPLGMKKKKKLSRFFIDQKLSRTEKEKVWVVEMNKKIIWVVGHRIDDRFKITPSTKNVLKLSLKNAGA